MNDINGIMISICPWVSYEIKYKIVINVAFSILMIEIFVIFKYSSSYIRQDNVCEHRYERLYKNHFFGFTRPCAN